jgi:hypothetical protein
MQSNSPSQAASAFPIVFAAVIGRLVSKIAAWKLERGAKLGILEQLMGSRTVFSTLHTQVILRSTNRLGLCLALLWALSPMGGQSALRIVDTTHKDFKAFPEVEYFDTNNTGSGWAAATVNVNETDLSFGQWDTLYTASLLASAESKFSNLDLWGNVKVPFMSSYRDVMNDTWTDVPPRYSPQDNGVDFNNGSVMAFSSLIGLPITGLQEGNSSFLLESNYLELDCSHPQVGAFDLNSTELLEIGNCHNSSSCPATFENGTFHGLGKLDSDTSRTWGVGLDNFIHPFWANGSWFRNTSSHLNISEAVEKSNLTTFFDRDLGSLSIFTNQPGIVANPTNLYFEAINETIFFSTTCAVNQVYVESRVNCSMSIGSKQNCSVVAQRPSQLLHPPKEITLLSYPRIFAQFSARFPKATAPGDPNLSLYYINNTSTGVMMDSHDGDAGAKSLVLNECSVSNGCSRVKQFSQRLGQLINSYLLLSQAGTSVTGTTDQGVLTVTTKSTNSSLVEVYVISIGWLCVFIIGTLAMLLAGIASIVISDRTYTPEILGYCSLALRDSKLIDLPPGGGTLDGLQMSRLLKDVEVQFGVVEESPTRAAKLGFSLKDNVSKADENRFYI